MATERVRFSGGPDEERIELEGLLDLPAGASGAMAGVVVCHPHPLYGGDMYNDVVGHAGRALLGRGVATLRFNFRGVGGSAGEHGGGHAERDDVWAALDLLRGRPEIDAARLGLCGYSFGAAVALNAGVAAGVRALAAISAPPRMLDFSAQQGYSIPVLLIAGDRDDFVEPERLQRLAAALGPATRTVIVPGADHFWSGHTERLEHEIGGFFAEQLA